MMDWPQTRLATRGHRETAISLCAGRAGVVLRLTVNLTRRVSATGLAAVVWAIALSRPTSAQTFAADVAAQNQAMYILLFCFVVLVVGLVVLFIPAIIAFRRQHPNRWAIAVICLAFGGTVVGWFGALIWALQAVHKSPTGSNGGESGLNIFVNDPVRVRIEPQGAVPVNALAATMPLDELSERLTRLKRLRESDAMSADEYTLMRQSILASI